LLHAAFQRLATEGSWYAACRNLSWRGGRDGQVRRRSLKTRSTDSTTSLPINDNGLRDAACPLSPGGGTRGVHLVRGGGGCSARCCFSLGPRPAQESGIAGPRGSSEANLGLTDVLSRPGQQLVGRRKKPRLHNRTSPPAQRSGAAPDQPVAAALSPRTARAHIVPRRTACVAAHGRPPPPPPSY